MTVRELKCLLEGFPDRMKVHVVEEAQNGVPYAVEATALDRLKGERSSYGWHSLVPVKQGRGGKLVLYRNVSR